MRLGEKPFLSIQGEGNRTGVLTLFIRLFGCNLECGGFKQKHPTDPSTWILPQFTSKEFKEVQKLNDLPVFEYGCDSGYSWSHIYKHLAKDYTDEELNDFIKSLVPYWLSANTSNQIDLCFTGGEPMLQQKNIIDFLDYSFGNFSFDDVDNYPQTIQIETNGTVPLKQNFSDWINEDRNKSIINWNISPKLYNVSGEECAWYPEIINSYFSISECGHIKFVINNSDLAWKELDDKVKELRDMNVYSPIYVMPVGSTKEQQTDTTELEQIAVRAIESGYHISGRLQSVLFNNSIAR